VYERLLNRTAKKVGVLHAQGRHEKAGVSKNEPLATSIDSSIQAPKEDDMLSREELSHIGVKLVLGGS
jgi:hypothetical protein